MYRIELDKDIKTLSDFRTNVSDFINQVHETKRPIIITQHGKSAAVLIDVAAYEKLIDKLEIIQDIDTSTKQIKEGKGISQKQAYSRLKRRFKE